MAASRLACMRGRQAGIATSIHKVLKNGDFEASRMETKTESFHSRDQTEPKSWQESSSCPNTKAFAIPVCKDGIKLQELNRLGSNNRIVNREPVSFNIDTGSQ